MLVKFECGCIGFDTFYSSPTNPKLCRRILKVADCRDPNDEVTVFLDDIGREKTYETLDPSEEEDIFLKLTMLVSDGYKFRKMKSLLGIKNEL
jgi:hypothetical protein